MSGSRTHWRKPPTRVYDYNYNLGEHYYKPQLRHAEQKLHGRASSPPKAKSFAERFVDDPVYGIHGPPAWRTTQLRRSSLNDDLGFGRRPSGDRYGDRFGPSDDSEFGRPSRFGPADDSELGLRRHRFPRDDEDEVGRFSFGDRLLNAAGARARGASPSPGVRFAAGAASPRVNMEDPFDEPFFQRGKRLGREGPLSADPDLLTEDPFKVKSRRGQEPSADELMEDMKREAESSASRFRSKLRAKRAQDELEDDSTAIESRLEKIRARARARMTDIEDDFPALSIRGEDSYGGLRAGKGASSLLDDYESSGGGSKTVRISKRSMRSTLESSD